MEPIEKDDRDTLCEAHRSFMERYIAHELERQEKVSNQFLAGKVKAIDSKALDSPEAQSITLSIKVVPGAV